MFSIQPGQHLESASHNAMHSTGLSISRMTNELVATATVNFKIYLDYLIGKTKLNAKY